MNKVLITCPICNADQHVYRNALCNHNDGTLRCLGSRTPIINGRAAKTFCAIAFEKKQNGIAYKGFIMQQRFYITSAPVIVGAEYELQELARGPNRGYELDFGGTKIEVSQFFDI